MKNRLYLFFVTVLFASLLLLIVGCTEKTERKTQDKNIETIEAILQKALTGPDDELKKAFNSEEDIENLKQYDKDHYNSYFANDTAYNEFVNSYGSVLMLMPLQNEYSLEVKNIEYVKTESKEIIYDFTVELQYQKGGSEISEVEMVKGQANLNEENKIEDMLIRVEGLWSSLDKN